MKRVFSLFALLLFSSVALLAQNAPPADEVAIRQVDIWGKRPMKQIGVEQTQLDSVVLQEHIALSMADVLSFNSPLFVKQYGRATLSTVSFRGTGPSHTQVTWNGMRISNPMLGMADFSLIPSYFIDEASLLYGSSSLSDASGSTGALGGLVKLATTPLKERGFSLHFVQGIGSFLTFDEYLRLGWADERWQLSTRLSYQTSENDFRYRNRDKKENIYNDQMEIVGSYYPIERNRSGAFRDLHLLQEVYYTTSGGDRLGLNLWYIDSNRELPLLTTDYAEETSFENRQRENTLRTLLSWEHLRGNWRIAAHGGYVHSWQAYDYKRDAGSGQLIPMTQSRSTINTLYAQVEGEWSLGERWLLTASLGAHQHFVESRDRQLVLQEGNQGILGYEQARIELDASLSAKWRPTERLGIAAVVREAMYGRRWTTPIPALYLDFLLSERGNLLLKGSLSRNYRFPTLNDLYFLPGGNPDLKNERGLQYEAGLSFAVGKAERYALSGSASWYDQRIDDWILWLPTTKGFFSPVNIKRVHAYGVAVEGRAEVWLSKQVRLALNGSFTWSPSINEGEPISPADNSVGKQLPYQPEFSAAASGRLTYRGWALRWQWNYYSTRYTMSSNDIALSGTLPPYFMNNLSLEKAFSWRWADFSAKVAINNLFDEEYLSVLARPMPGIHGEIFLSIKPKWGKRKQ